MLHLLALCLCAAPVEATFLLTVQDVPLARLSVKAEGRAYHYETTHFLEEGEAHFSRELSLDDGAPRPEVLALLTPPAAGCQAVLEEREARPERLCVESSRGSTVKGRLETTAFTASYAHGSLQHIEVGASRWERIDGAAPLPGRPGQNPFAEGFEVLPAPHLLRLEPPVPGARVIRAVHPVGAEGDVGRVRCLPLARRWVASRPSAHLITGLVIEGGRAFPHAWAREGAHDVDPSMLPGDDLSARTYLELPAGLAGRAYLELLAGTRVVRGR